MAEISNTNVLLIVLFAIAFIMIFGMSCSREGFAPPFGRRAAFSGAPLRNPLSNPHVEAKCCYLECLKENDPDECDDICFNNIDPYMQQTIQWT